MARTHTIKGKAESKARTLHHKAHRAAKYRPADFDIDALVRELAQNAQVPQ